MAVFVLFHIYMFMANCRVVLCVTGVSFHVVYHSVICFDFLNSMKREGRTVTKTLIRDMAFTKGETSLVE